MTKTTCARAILSLLLIASTTRTMVTSAAPPSAGTGEADTQRHFHEGVALFRAGQIDRACELFQASFNEAPLPGTLYNLARCREAQGRFGEAYRDLDDLATRAARIESQATQAASLRADADKLIPKLARIDLVHRADSVTDVTRLAVDGTVTPVDAWKKPLYVMPGVHALSVEHADASVVTRTTKPLAAGEVATIEMEDPLPLPATPMGPVADGPLLAPVPRVDAARRRVAYVVGAGGVVVLGAGLVLGVVALLDRNSANSVCGGDRTNCTPGTPANVAAATSDLSSSRHLATFSTIGVVAGGAALAAATYLFFSAREAAPAPASVAVLPYANASGGGLGAFGSF